MANTPRLSEKGGCLIAWLIVLLLVLGVGAMAYFYVGIVLYQGGQTDAGLMSILLSVAFSAGAAGAGALLSRKKYGVYLIVLSFLAAGVLQFLTAYRIEIAAAGLFNIALIAWLVRPVWDRLD